MLRTAASRQVVLLVKDDQAEAGAHLVHVDVGAVVGRDGNRPDIEEVVAHDPGVKAQGSEDSPVPLVHQVSHRGYHQRGGLGLRHRRQRHFGFAGAGRHDDLPRPPA